MCWSLRVYWTVLHNLFIRFITHLGENFRNNKLLTSFCCCYICKSKQSQNVLRQQQTLENAEDTTTALTHVLQHDYVIVDEIDAGYLEIEQRKIETEQYYRLVDRATAEDILNGRENGSCLVRPYKEMDMCIKYIVTIYVKENLYFHLFIRHIREKNCYAIGQRKHNERYFPTPNHIIEFYSCQPLLCSNKITTQRLTLKPILD